MSTLPAACVGYVQAHDKMATSLKSTSPVFRVRGAVNLSPIV